MLLRVLQCMVQPLHQRIFQPQMSTVARWKNPLHASTHFRFATILQASYYYYFLHFTDEEMRLGDVKRTVQGHSRTRSQDAKPGVWDVDVPTCSHVTNRLSVDVLPNWVCVLTHIVTALSKFWKDVYQCINACL